MARRIALVSAVIFCCNLHLAAQAESPVSSYSITADKNAYDYSNSIANGAYVGAKDFPRGNADFYTGGNNAHSWINGASQTSLGGTLGSSSYSGFSPSSHNSGFAYPSNTRDSVPASTYSLSSQASSSFGGYTSTNSNGDSAFEGYTSNQEPDRSQYSSSSHSSPSSTFSEAVADGTSFRGYSGGSTRGSTTGYLDGDQAGAGDSSYLFNGPSNEYSFEKTKDSIFGAGGSTKYVNDVHSSPSDVRYIRGSHGGVQMGHDHGSSMYLSSSASGIPFSGMRASPSDIFGSGKINKYSNKYFADYGYNSGANYPSKNFDTDYPSGGYGKGGGKVVVIKDSRPGSYNTQAFSGVPSYISKIVSGGGYKSKPSSFMSYPGHNVGYSSMSNLHGSYSGGYRDSPSTRGYRSSNGGYVSGSTYPGYS